MDCGPAALKCLLEGFGVAASYDRLREACQTDVDGTSIDTLEEVAVALGLEAEQVMIPPDHLLLDEAESLPALVVVRNAIGSTHFVVVWRRLGRWVLVMDPASGRRWTTVRDFVEELYHHTLQVPAAAWREWAGSDDFLRPLERRMERLGLGRRDRRALLDEAVADPEWSSLARLDAAVRLLESVAGTGGVRRGREAGALLRGFLARRSRESRTIPASFWSVRTAGTDGCWR